MNAVVLAGNRKGSYKLNYTSKCTPMLEQLGMAPAKQYVSSDIRDTNSVDDKNADFDLARKENTRKYNDKIR